MILMIEYRTVILTSEDTDAYNDAWIIVQAIAADYSVNLDRTLDYLHYMRMTQRHMIEVQE